MTSLSPMRRVLVLPGVLAVPRKMVLGGAPNCSRVAGTSTHMRTKLAIRGVLARVFLRYVPEVDFSAFVAQTARKNDILNAARGDRDCENAIFCADCTNELEAMESAL